MSKYGNKRIVIDNIPFDSLKEGARYVELKAMSQGGAITDLEIHPEYPLWVCQKLIGKYVADFVYMEDGKRIVEDVKGVKTAVYRLKKKLMKAIHEIDILET